MNAKMEQKKMAGNVTVCLISKMKSSQMSLVKLADSTKPQLLFWGKRSFYDLLILNKPYKGYSDKYLIYRWLRLLDVTDAFEINTIFFV